MKQTLLIFLLSHFIPTVAYADNVLVTIGNAGQVTEQQLQSAMQAAPFATQFPTMDEQDQAYLRGDMLLRLARAEALYQEAVTTGIKETQVFQLEMSNFKTALLAQLYLANLRNQIKLPESQKQQLERQFIGNSDALTAARSAFIAKQFVARKLENLNKLRDAAGVETFFQRLDQTPGTDTVLAEGEGLTIKYGDSLAESKSEAKLMDKERVITTVNEWIDLTLMAKQALQQGANIDGQLADYARNLSVRLLLSEKEKQWIGSEQVLLDYFQTHPNIGFVPERRQIGQIVLASREQAETMRNRILAGESLFELAGQYSIDPYGQQRAGDMGWLTEGSAAPEIENAIRNLKDNEVSEIINTEKGWHLVVIVNRKPAEHKDFAAIKDRVRQKLIAEKMTEYLRQVTEKYPLQWKIAERNSAKL